MQVILSGKVQHRKRAPKNENQNEKGNKNSNN